MTPVQNALFINRLIEDGYPVLSDAVGILNSIENKFSADIKGTQAMYAEILKYP
jgi:hypothetical protein